MIAPGCPQDIFIFEDSLISDNPYTLAYNERQIFNFFLVALNHQAYQALFTFCPSQRVCIESADVVML